MSIEKQETNAIIEEKIADSRGKILKIFEIWKIIRKKVEKSLPSVDLNSMPSQSTLGGVFIFNYFPIFGQVAPSKAQVALSNVTFFSALVQK